MLFCTTNVLAVDPDIKKTDLNFPKSKVEQSENYSLPDSIYLVPLRLGFTEFVTTSDWYKGMYYYQTYRLNQGDILFHYLVTKDGEVLQGNSKGEEQRFALKDDESKPVIVAYMPGNGEDDFSEKGRSKLNSLVVDIANRNRIKLENILVKSLGYQVTEQQQIVGVPDIVAGRWERSLKDMINEMNEKYDPAKFKFEIEVVEFNVTQEPVNFGDQVVADLTIKNNSEISLYEGSDFEPIMTKNNKEDFSKFFINRIWLGPKQAKVMAEGSNIRPGETKTFKIKLGVPLYDGKQTESFNLINVLGEAYEGTDFEVTLNINKTEKDAVEITSTPVGYLNVRENPNGSSTLVTKVSPGQRFLVVERQNSWIKIDAGENGQGWIAVQYTKKL